MKFKGIIFIIAALFGVAFASGETREQQLGSLLMGKLRGTQAGAAQQEESRLDETGDDDDGAAVFERWQETLSGDDAPAKTMESVHAAESLINALDSWVKEYKKKMQDGVFGAKIMWWRVTSRHRGSLAASLIPIDNTRCFLILLRIKVIDFILKK